MTVSPRILIPLVLAFALALSSCGGGTTTVGSGESGIGGTGITTVVGNVSQVIDRDQGDDLARAQIQRAVAEAMDWITTPVNASSTRLGGIKVFGGGQSATTDDSGNFKLEGVSPSDNFVLTFVFEDDETVSLPIGSVPPRSRVQVNNIVVDIEKGFATPGSVEVEEDFHGPGAGQGDDPGQSGNPPGQSGNPPGQSGNPPGQGGSPPGQSGTPPGQNGSPPGQSGNPGQGGNAE